MAARKTSRSNTASSRTASSRRTTARRTQRKAPSGKPASRAGRSRASAKATKTDLTWGKEDGGPQVPMHTITPNIVPTDCAAALDWYAKVFGAKELARMPGPGGRIMHAMMQVGDTVVMLSDNFGPPIDPDATACAFLHVHDKAIQRFWDDALAEGAAEVMPLADQFWGDKYGQFRDPFGITWSLGWPANLSKAEKDRLEREAMQQMAAQVGA
jgi:PhnB protein